MALAKVVARGKDDDPQKRFPSAGEIASAIRLSGGLGAELQAEQAWPVVGIDGVAQALVDAAIALQPGRALVVVGEAGAGR